VEDLLSHPHRPHDRHGLPECGEVAVIPGYARVILEFARAISELAAADLDARHNSFEPRAAIQRFVVSLLRVRAVIAAIGVAVLHALRTGCDRPCAHCKSKAAR
jgi:hypothetical protein